MTIEERLDELVRRYNFIAAVMATADGRVIARTGDARAPEWNDPYNSFFRDRETIQNTFEHLKASKPPRSLAQGQREVIVFQPRPDLIVGMVKDDPRTVIEMYQLRKQLAPEIDRAFEEIEIA